MSSLKGRSKQPTRGSSIAANRRYQNSGVEHEFMLYNMILHAILQYATAIPRCPYGWIGFVWL